MDFFTMSLIVKVAEIKHFTNAAYELNISESSLSKRIAGVEKELDAKLFNRTTRNVTLTPAGEVFISHAKKILGEHETMITDIRDLTSQVLRIGMISKLYDEKFSSFFSTFLNKNSNVTIELNQANTSELISLLDTSRLDIVFGVVRDDILQRADLEIYPLFEDEIMLIVNRKNPLAKNKSVEISQLVNESVIGLDVSSSTEKIIKKAFQSQGYSLKIVHRSSETDIILDFVKEKNYIALLAKKVYLASKPQETLTCIPLIPPIKRTTAIIVNKKSVGNNHVIRKFIQHILSKTKNCAF